MSNSREDSGWEDDFDPQSLIGITVDNGDVHALRLTQLLGSGSYALVYAAEPVDPQYTSPTCPDVPEQQTTTHQNIAVKVLFKRGLSAHQMRLQRIEAELLTTLGEHEGIVRLRRITEDRDFLYLVLDRCDEDLYEGIASGRVNGKAVFYDLQDEMDMVECVKDAFCQIARSVAFCHSRSVYHRDLKPENILTVVNPSNGLLTTKLTDFGLATRERRCFDYGTGSGSYTSPEALRPPANKRDDEGYDAAANDVWSLGIVLFNLLTSKNPWVSASDDDESYVAFKKWFKRVTTASPQSTVPLSPISLEFGLSDRCDAIFKRVFDPEPRNRCGVAELVELVVGVPRFNATRAVAPFPHKLSTSLPAPAGVPLSPIHHAHQMRRNRSWSSDVSDMDFSNVPVFDDASQAAMARGGSGGSSRRFSRASLLSIDGLTSPVIGVSAATSLSLAMSAMGSRTSSRNSMVSPVQEPMHLAFDAAAHAKTFAQVASSNLRRPLLLPTWPTTSATGLAGSRSSLVSPSPHLHGSRMATPPSSPLSFKKLPMMMGSLRVTALNPSAARQGSHNGTGGSGRSGSGSGIMSRQSSPRLGRPPLPASAATHHHAPTTVMPTRGTPVITTSTATSLNGRGGSGCTMFNPVSINPVSSPSLLSSSLGSSNAVGGTNHGRFVPLKGREEVPSVVVATSPGSNLANGKKSRSRKYRVRSKWGSPPGEGVPPVPPVESNRHHSGRNSGRNARGALPPLVPSVSGAAGSTGVAVTSEWWRPSAPVVVPPRESSRHGFGTGSGGQRLVPRLLPSPAIDASQLAAALFGIAKSGSVECVAREVGVGVGGSTPNLTVPGSAGTGGGRNSFSGSGMTTPPAVIMRCVVQH